MIPSSLSRCPNSMSASSRAAANRPSPFQVDSDIRTARTPPSALYHDPAYFAHQQDTVFARSWHLVGDVRELKTAGSVKPFTLLEGCLDEPLFLIRDEGETLHCLSNVSAHRGNLLVEGKGTCRAPRFSAATTVRRWAPTLTSGASGSDFKRNSVDSPGSGPFLTSRRSGLSRRLRRPAQVPPF